MMRTEEMLNPKLWAEHTFGSSQLKDVRRTRRAVQVAEQMAANASASLPAQMQGWKEVIALYRLLDEEDVSFEALMQPHWRHTREQILSHPVVLLVQDTTEIDLSHHPHTSGLGQVGNERGRGFYLQTMLAVLPESRSVLGCALQEPFVRTPAPVGERRSQRRFRQGRETDIWMRLVSQMGNVAAETCIVHVGDRGADMFEALLMRVRRPTRIFWSEPLKIGVLRAKTKKLAICWIRRERGPAKIVALLMSPPAMEGRLA